MLNSEGLPKGYQIQNYRIEGILGAGGFGITYKAVDLNLNRLVAIKEFMPQDIAVRSNTGDVEPKNLDCQEIYQNGLMNFVKEAQALALFEHDNIVKVKAFLRHHNTAYIIMEYVDGMTFSEWLRLDPMPSEEDLLGIVSPILAGLHELHKIDLLHRDIKPGNIYICKNDRPILLDFGAVRNSIPENQNNDPSVIMLTEGYAPPEQYGKTGQGPWTDVYAVGACLHLAVTGQKVMNAMERYTQVFNGNPDPQPSLKDAVLRNDYSDHFLDAIEQAISLNPKDRIRDASNLNHQLLNTKPPQTPGSGQKLRDSQHASTKSKNNIQLQKNVNKDLSESVSLPAGSDPATEVLTIARERIENGQDPRWDPKSNIDQAELTPHKNNAVTSDSGSRTSKVLMWAGVVAGLVALVWFVGPLMMKEQVPDSVLNDAKSQIDRKVKIIGAMKLPTTGDYKNAMNNRQLAMDIESKKVDGSVKDIRNNLTTADRLFEEHILSTAPMQNAELLGAVNSMIDKATQLGVEGIAYPDLSKFSLEATDIESLSSNYSELLIVAKELEDGLKRNARSYVIGSSAQDIAEAMGICKQYASGCAQEWYEDEMSRSITLSPFELDKSEVTVGEFSQYAEAQNIVTSAEEKGFSYTVDPGKNFAVLRSNGNYWKNAYGVGNAVDRFPVVHIDRADALDYCKSLGKRLPTEAEWEYVARGTNRFTYPWGDTWDPARVNWGGGKEESILPVNSFQASDSGFFDLAGSVTEWTSTDSEEENTAILKGGSRFDTNVANLRLPVRRLESIDYTGEDVGFRCARTVDEWPVI